MSHNRLDYLNNNRIIYRRYPVNDKPTHDFVWGWFYEQGTHEYYYLFHSASMITTYRSLKWHMLVLSYLNTEMTNDNFKKLYKYITNRDNGFTTFSINNNDSSRIFKEILNSDFERAPKNKARKVIFKMGCGLTKTEKLNKLSKYLHEVDNIEYLVQYFEDFNQNLSKKVLPSYKNFVESTV